MALRNRRQLAMLVPPWMILGGALILLTVVVLLSIQSINREKRHMIEILSEKGAVLIKSLEAGARTGMMGMMWSGDQIQLLLEETARQGGVLYIAVTDEDGTVLAHSDPNRIGRRLLEPGELEILEAGSEERWRPTASPSGGRAFEVYRVFRPMGRTEGGRGRGMGRGMGMRAGRGDWFSHWGDPGQERIIFLGMDMRPFEEAREEDIRNAVVLSGVLLLLGFGGFFSMFLAQGFRAARRQLRDTSAFAAQMVTHLPVGLIATGRDGRIALFNAAAEKITGLRAEGARGRPLREVLPDHLCGLEPVIENGEVFLERELDCVFTQGRPVSLSVSATRVRNEDGEFAGNVVILRDLGELRRLEREIRKAEKLAAVGRLAAGVAHEIRNPLSSIKGLASYFGGKSPRGSEDEEAAGVMIREVDRLNRAVTELLEFARPSELKPRRTEVNGLLQQSLRLIRQDAATKGIHIRLETAEGVPGILLDPDRFTQCLLNLYLNAIQSTEPGGVMTVRSLLDAAGNVCLEVEDTGRGIEEEHLGRIFDPYFTTKASGTGLGLAVVQKIVEAHGAEITVRSRPGKGTAVTVCFPAGGRTPWEGGP